MLISYFSTFLFWHYSFHVYFKHLQILMKDFPTIICLTKFLSMRLVYRMHVLDY